MFNRMDQHFERSYCPWTMLAVYLTVLCSNLCIGDTLSVPQTTFNTARTTASITTAETSLASPSKGPTTSCTAGTDGSASPVAIVTSFQKSSTTTTVSSINQEGVLDQEAVHNFTKVLNRTERIRKVVMLESGSGKLLKLDSNDSPKTAGTTTRLMTALTTITLSTRTTTMVTVNGTEGVSPHKILIKGVAAFTSPKQDDCLYPLTVGQEWRNGTDGNFPTTKVYNYPSSGRHGHWKYILGNLPLKNFWEKIHFIN